MWQGECRNLIIWYWEHLGCSRTYDMQLLKAHKLMEKYPKSFTRERYLWSICESHISAHRGVHAKLTTAVNRNRKASSIVVTHTKMKNIINAWNLSMKNSEIYVCTMIYTIARRWMHTSNPSALKLSKILEVQISADPRPISTLCQRKPAVSRIEKLKEGSF